MARAFDISKFRKTLTKSIEGIGLDFNDPTDWISTGNFALNYLISGDFKKGIPLGKVTVFAGESGCLPASAKVSVSISDLVTVAPTEPFHTITVGELREYVKYGNHLVDIDTPDGPCRIINWFDKGVLAMVKIVLDNGMETECAVNHLVQTSDNNWVAAEVVLAGSKLLTKTGIATVTSVEKISDAECYDFTVNHVNHRYYGDGISSHNSGKSYICSANIVKDAQRQGIFPIVIDTENALDESWMNALGVDTGPDAMLKINLCMIDDVAKTVSEFMKEYKALDPEKRDKVLFVVDSLGMLLTPTDVAQFESGDLKGDMGRKPKALAALVRNCVNIFGSYNVGMVCTNHTYDSQDPYNPDPKVSGGSMFVYASSIVVAMKKLKLKEDEDGNKVSEVTGIRAGCKIMKTRYNKPFEDIELRIPYERGMDPYSGMFELLEKRSLIAKEGNRYSYVDTNGEIHKYFRKEWIKNENRILDLVMEEFHVKNPPAMFNAEEDVIEFDETMIVEEE